MSKKQPTPYLKLLGPEKTQEQVFEVSRMKFSLAEVLTLILSSSSTALCLDNMPRLSKRIKVIRSLT